MTEYLVCNLKQEKPKRTVWLQAECIASALCSKCTVQQAHCVLVHCEASSLCMLSIHSPDYAFIVLVSTFKI